MQILFPEKKITRKQTVRPNIDMPVIENPRSKNLLFLGESTVYEGPIQKRVGLSVKRRILVLTTRPRLFYFDPETNEIKGEINVCKDLKVNLGAKNKWTIEVPGRVYNLVSDENPKNWKEVIDKIVRLI